MNKDTVVKCDVESCKHNESHNCNLDILNIGCTCDNENCSKKQETICNDFIKNN